MTLHQLMQQQQKLNYIKLNYIRTISLGQYIHTIYIHHSFLYLFKNGRCWIKTRYSTTLVIVNKIILFSRLNNWIYLFYDCRNVSAPSLCFVLETFKKQSKPEENLGQRGVSTQIAEEDEQQHPIPPRPPPSSISYSLHLAAACLDNVLKCSNPKQTSLSRARA